MAGADQRTSLEFRPGRTRGFRTRSRKGVRRVAFALGKTGMRRLVGLRTGGRTGAAPLACAAVLTSVACLTTCS